VTHFLAARLPAADDGRNLRSTEPAMNDRRMLRRYLALVRHAEDRLEASLGDDVAPPPAEAIVVIEDLVESLEPLARKMQAEAPRVKDVRETLAGWVH